MCSDIMKTSGKTQTLFLNGRRKSESRFKGFISRQFSTLIDFMTCCAKYMIFILTKQEWL